MGSFQGYILLSKTARYDSYLGVIIADQIAVESIRIACNYCALCIHDGHYIALKIGDVVVENTIVLQRIGIAIGIVEEVQGVTAKAFTQQFTTGIIVGVLNTVDCLTGSQTVGVIGVADGISAIAGGGQSATLCPCECPTGIIVVTRNKLSYCRHADVMHKSRD